MQLRPFQISAIEKTREALHRGVKRPLIYGPTGSGKTEIGIEIMRAAREKNKRVAFLCNRITLVEQASRRLEKSGLPHGVIQGQNTIGAKRNVLVCSIQTLARRGYPPLDLAIIDEAHGATAEVYLNFIQAYPNIPIIGLSATPFTRGLGREYEWGKPFEEIIVAATIPELVEQGYLVDCDVYAPYSTELFDGLKGVPIVRGDYDEKKLGAVVDKPTLVGDIVEHWFRLGYGRQTVVFATNIAHSQHICAAFNAMGVRAEHLDCYTTKQERAAIFARFESGETTVLCNVSVLAEGWDSPACSCMILARPTRSLTRYIQMAGRILRPFPGKERGLLLDHSATSTVFGYPTDELPLELNDGKRATSTLNDPTPGEEPPRCCSVCGYLLPKGMSVCPKCGFKPTRQNKVQAVEGKLTKLERKHQFALEHKQEIWSGCLGLAAKRKRSEGWAAHLYKDITGIYPKGVTKTPCEPTQIVLDYDTARRIKYAKGKHNQKEQVA